MTISSAHTPPSALPSWTLPIENWSSWQLSSEEPSPDISFIHAALRRKLSLLTKMSLKVAHDCSEELSSVRFVYASRHGDLGRTTDMLADLARGEELSPTAFSLSVLNATPGIYSIARNNHASSIAVSAVENTLIMGLLEAYLQFSRRPDTPVLFVYAEDEVPSLYDLPNKDIAPHAIALLLSPAAKNHLVIQPSQCSSSNTRAAQCLLEVLNQKSSEHISGFALQSWHEN